MPNTSKFIVAAALIGASLAAGRARAELLSSAGNGFEVRETAHSAAAPDKVYAALLLPARWWSADHTFSGNAANLVLEARAGGCWCETLPNGGSVEHMRVLYVAPGKILRLRGAVGPFQALAVEGVLTFTLTSAAGGTDITLSYVLGGYAKDGFEALSKAADHVLGEQVERLSKFAEGEPAPHAH